MTRLRSLFAVLFVALLGWGVAQTLELPQEITGEVGHFVSFLVKADKGDRLELDLPDTLQLVSMPTLDEGQALVNLFVTKQTAAGENLITVRLYDGDTFVSEAQVRLGVQVQGGLELRAPPGDTVVSGEEVRYTLVVNNTGNSSDTVRLDARSSLPVRLEPEVLTLAPRESRSATLILKTEGKGADTAIVTARSGVDPELDETAIIRTTVQPFAGAGELDGPVLGYGLELSAGYGSDGVDYRLNARLEGSLSEFVEVGSALSFENEQLSGSLGLSGDDWGVAYRGVGNFQRLEGRYGPFQGFFSTLLGENVSGGFVYEDDPLNLSLTHRSAAEQSDTFRASYRFALDPTFSLSPSLELRGRGSYAAGAYSVGTLLGLSATLNNETLSGSSRFQIGLPYDALEPWRYDLALSSRVQDPIGVGGELSVSADELSARVSVQETVSDEVRLTQGLGYSSDLGFERTNYSLRFGVTYEPFALPLTLSGSGLTSLNENVFELGYSVSAQYQWNALNFEAAVAQLSLLNDPGVLRYGAGLAYRHRYFDLDFAYQHDSDSDLVLLGLGGDYRGFEGSLQSGYDFRTTEYLLNSELAYTISPRYRMFGGVGLNNEAFTLRAGGTITFEGGFATPDGVVDLFGGRAAGIVAGSVFHDLNRNGSREESEPLLSNVTVRVGEATAKARDGSYRLVVAPGSYALSLGNLPADLALRDDVQLTVEQNERVELELAVETVVGFTGTTANDSNRNGQLDDNEDKLPYVRVNLTNAAGLQQSTLSDDRGSFFFQALRPGSYTVTLDASSLPEGYERTTGAVDLELAPGPFPRITLGATAKPKEIARSLSTESLTLITEVRPNPAAPGMSIEVMARVRGNPDKVIATMGNAESSLEAIDEQTFKGRITIPEDAVGIVALKVASTRGDGATTEQQTLIIIDPSIPLAELRLSPAFVDPGEEISVSAEFFKEVETPYLVIGDTRYPLEAQGDYTFSLTFPAPDAPGSYEVDLWADDTHFANTRIRVDEVRESSE